MILHNSSKYSAVFMALVAFIIVNATPAYAVGSADDPQALVKATTEKMFAKLKAENKLSSQ